MNFQEVKEYIIREWELRFCVIFSLFLQIFLIVAGTFKRSSSKWIVFLLWLAYSSADIVATFGLGLIVSRQGLYLIYCNDGFTGFCYVNQIHAYWTAFLLVHLGGADFFTSFAPEDNELWRRHLFYLASQCTNVAYCFYQTKYYIRAQQEIHVSQLRIPSILVLLCGIIKCSERVCAKYYGSANTFRSSILSVPDLNSYKRDKLLITTNEDAFSHLQMLQYAFVYFTAFKRLIFRLNLRIYERSQSREFFLATSNKDAFRLVEVELNYIHDVLFTKLPVLHHKFGFCSRTLSFTAVVASLTLFHFSVDKDVMYYPDIVITYVLLIGAVTLDVIQFLMLLFCNWTVVNLRPLFDSNTKHKSWKHKFVDWIVIAKITTKQFQDWLFGFVRDRDHHCPSEFANFATSRWAKYVSAFNLIYYCLHRRSKGKEKIYNCFGIVSLLDKIWYVKSQPLTYYIIDFIVNELKMKSQMADSLSMAKQICSSKGEWVLHEIEGLDTFLPFVAKYNYDDILLLWHIATEVCYNDRQDQLTNNLEQRDTAKHLSDYMLYLMVMKPDMMSAVSSTGEIKFLDTCIEVSKLFGTKLSKRKKKMCCFFGRENKEEKEALQMKACETIFTINSEVKPVVVQKDGYKDGSKLLLFNASLLAKELKMLPSEKKWLTISKLWVELLSYAASHISSSAHAQELNKGGELITVVWLLMAHFGLGDQYEISPGSEEDG